jgi:hypothetical protein
MTPNRTVAVVSALISLALGILPVVGNFDWQSTAGVIAGIVAVLGVTQKWLDGWIKHEATVAEMTGRTVDRKPGIVKRKHRLPRPAERPE